MPLRAFRAPKIPRPYAKQPRQKILTNYRRKVSRIKSNAAKRRTR